MVSYMASYKTMRSSRRRNSFEQQQCEITTFQGCGWRHNSSRKFDGDTDFTVKTILTINQLTNDYFHHYHLYLDEQTWHGPKY